MVDVAGPSNRSPLAPGARLLVETALGPIAVFEVDGTVRAIEDGCLRCGSSLATGKLDGAVVTCRVCGWRYDIASGCLVGLPALRVPTCKVRASRSD
jgi:3-phenylpropionate/trans-cinnamate dioxygenase ferredoxin component